MQNRTHTCDELRLSDAGKRVQLSGWMDSVRIVSANLAFVILRDFYGTTQVVIDDEEQMKIIRSLNKESVISVTGIVRERDNKNPKIPTGDIEVEPEKIDVLGRCRYNELPFQINRSREADEEHPPEVPLSRPAQPRCEEKHRPALQGRHRPAPAR